MDSVLSYDVKNRQISYLNGTTAAVYTYHPDNLRKTKTVNGATTNFVWADGNLVHEYTNTSTKTYFYAIILAGDSAGQAYLYNTHGDVVKLIGTLTWSYQYDAYGVQQNPDPIDTNAFRYAGQYFDTESGTYYLRARYYNPATGRFTQPDRHWNISNSLYGDDPLKLNGYTVPSIAAVMQSTNLYVYCMGNPVRSIDPSGEISLSYIHNLVVADVRERYEAIGMTSNKMIDYQNGRHGFADLVSISTGEVWEVKKSTVPLPAAKKQLAKYTSGVLHNEELREIAPQLYTGGSKETTIEGRTFQHTIGFDTYTIHYWDAGDGIIQYEYSKQTNWQQVGEVVGEIALFVSISALLLLTGGAAAPVVAPVLP